MDEEGLTVRGPRQDKKKGVDRGGRSRWIVDVCGCDSSTTAGIEKRTKKSQVSVSTVF